MSEPAAHRRLTAAAETPSPPPRAYRPGPRRFAAILFAIAALPGWAWAGQAQPDAPPPTDKKAPQSEPAPRDVLLDPDRSEAERLDAARRLLRQRPGELAALLGPGAPDAAFLAVAEAIRVCAPEDLPQEGALARRLAERVDVANSEVTRAALQALGRFHDREAVRQVVNVLKQSSSSRLRSEAMKTLTAQTGRVDLGHDRDAWLAWWAEVEWLPENLWLRRIAQAQQRRAEAWRRSAESLEARLAEARASLVASTPEAERAAALASMLADPVAQVRQAGVDLVERALANAEPLAPGVVAAMLDLLTDPAPALRAEAAALLSNIRPDGLPGKLAAALRTETSATVAAALLSAAEDAAPADAIDSAVRWLGGEEPAASAAAGFLYQAARRGRLDHPSARQAALRALRDAAEQELTTPVVRLLAAIGESKDRAWLAERFLEATGPARVALARALAAASPSSVAALVEAARRDPALFEVTVEALVRHVPTVAAVGLVRSLPAPSENGRREGLVRLANALPPGQLAAAAREIDDPELRETLLSARLEGSATPLEEASGATELWCLLAESRLEQGRAEAALETLSNVAPEIARARRTRTLALLVTGRVDEAAAIDGVGPSVWLEGLGLCLNQDLPHAATVLEAIERRYSDRLSEAESARLGVLRDQVIALQEST